MFVAAKTTFIWLVVLLVVALSSTGFSAKLKTNQVEMTSAPDWLDERMVLRATRRIQRYLEWDVRRVPVKWYSTDEEFEARHGLGKGVLAVTNRKDGTISMGPRVTQKKFAGIFGHELAHVVLLQKYKSAIPLWIEEGLANHASGHEKVNYPWLVQQNRPKVRTLSHSFSGSKKVSAKLHYQLSTAAVEFIAAKCPIHDLLQLSVGKKLERYLKTFCGIKNVDLELGQWISSKVGRMPDGPKPKTKKAASEPPQAK